MYAKQNVPKNVIKSLNWWFKSTENFRIFGLAVLSTQLHQEMDWLFLIASNGDFRALTFVPLCRLHFWSRSVRVAERLALPTSDHGVAGSNPAGGKILPEPKWRFIAQSLSSSPFHRLEMTEILLKGRKTLTHPSIHPSFLVWLQQTFWGFWTIN